MKKKVLLIGSNSFVGQSIISGLDDSYQIIPAAGHHAPKNGYQLPAEEPKKLWLMETRKLSSLPFAETTSRK